MKSRGRTRSVGEIISTVCFYSVGVYFLIEGTALRDAGGDKVKYFGIWLAGLTCMMGGARFLIADLIVGVKSRIR